MYVSYRSSALLQIIKYQKMNNNYAVFLEGKNDQTLVSV